MNVWPVPAGKIVNVSFKLDITGDVKFILYDLSGRIIKTEMLKSQVAGTNAFNLQISDLKPANYIIEIVTKDDILRKKFVKE